MIRYSPCVMARPCKAREPADHTR